MGQPRTKQPGKTETWADNIIKDARKGALPVMLLSGGVNLLLLTTPLYMLQVYDRVLTSQSSATLFWISVIAFGALAALGVFDALRMKALAELSQWVAGRAAPKVLDASMKASLRGGPQNARHLRDLGLVQTFLGGGSLVPFFDAPWAILFVIAVFMLHPVIGWLTLIGGIVLFLIAFFADRASRKAAEDSRREEIDAMVAAEGFIQGADYLESAGMRTAAVERYMDSHSKLRERQLVTSSVTSTATGMSKFVRLVLQIGALGLGALLVLDNQMSPGGMIAGSILLGRALAPVEQSINAWRQFKLASDAMKSLRTLAEVSDEDAERTQLPEGEASMVAKGAGYYYPNTRQPLLHNINFEAKPGRLFGIVGPSGTGKTTLCRLLTGVETATTGTIRLNDADVRHYDRDQWGRLVGYLPQSPTFYDGTIWQNISRFRSDAKDEDVIAAAEATGAHDLILQLPDAYQTVIGPRGSRLSGGQAQVVGLARATFGAPRVIVMDEPTAHLDDKSKQAFGQFVKRALNANRVIIIATHDRMVFDACDEVLVLRNGSGKVINPKDQAQKNLTAEPETSGA